jgi:hypothetical protein
MGDRRISLKLRATHLESAMRALLAFSPEAENQKLAQSRALAAIEDAFENRRYRIAVSRMETDLIQWIAVLVLSATVLITIASVHVQQRWAMAVGLFRVLDRRRDLPRALDGIRQTLRSRRLRHLASGLPRCYSRLTPYVSAMPPRSPACAPPSRPCGSARYSAERISWRREAARANSNASGPSAPG